MSSDTGADGAPPPPPPSAPHVRLADILFVADVLDPTGGNPKGRRVVVLTFDDALAAGFPIVAAPVTSRIPPVPGRDHVVLPSRRPPGTRHPTTGLTRRAGIVATSLVIVYPAAIAGYSGYVPRRTMAVVQAKTEACARALGGWPRSARLTEPGDRGSAHRSGDRDPHVPPRLSMTLWRLGSAPRTAGVDSSRRGGESSINPC